MPSERPDKEKGRSGSGSSKEKEKDKSKEKQKGKSGKDGKSGEKQSVAEIKAEEYEAFVKACVETHAAWLATPLLNIGPALSMPIPYFATLLLLLLTLLLLLSPAAWIPHIASPIVLLIPLQNTLECIAHESRTKGGNSLKAEGDAVQLMIFWVGWVLLGWMGEGVRLFRPGWRGVWEIGKVGAGIVLAGPWFGRAAMISGKPSPKLAEAEKREAAETAREEKERSKRGAGKEDEAKAKAKAKAQAEKRAKEKAKEKKDQ